MFKAFAEIIKDHFSHRSQIMQLAKLRQKKAYKGSDFGWGWAFIKPAMYVLVFYFAISIGFKSSKDVVGIITPYFIWLTTGIIPWFYIRDMILGGAGSFIRNKYLVTRVQYPISTIPAIVSMSNITVHLILMGGVFVLAMFFGVKPSIYWLEIPFYTLMMILFATVWGLAAGLMTVLARDFFNFVSTLSTAIFWLSGILYDVHKMSSPTAQRMFMFNPVTFIVDGYRNAICRHIWFFDEPEKLVCFLIVFFVMLLLGVWLYKKLKKVIPDII